MYVSLRLTAIFLASAIVCAFANAQTPCNCANASGNCVCRKWKVEWPQPNESFGSWHFVKGNSRTEVLAKAERYMKHWDWLAETVGGSRASWSKQRGPFCYGCSKKPQDLNLSRETEEEVRRISDAVEILWSLNASLSRVRRISGPVNTVITGNPASLSRTAPGRTVRDFEMQLKRSMEQLSDLKSMLVSTTTANLDSLTSRIESVLEGINDLTSTAARAGISVESTRSAGGGWELHLLSKGQGARPERSEDWSVLGGKVARIHYSKEIWHALQDKPRPREIRDAFTNVAKHMQIPSRHSDVLWDFTLYKVGKTFLSAFLDCIPNKEREEDDVDIQRRADAAILYPVLKAALLQAPELCESVAVLAEVEAAYNGYTAEYLRHSPDSRFPNAPAVRVKWAAALTILAKEFRDAAPRKPGDTTVLRQLARDKVDAQVLHGQKPSSIGHLPTILKAPYRSRIDSFELGVVDMKVQLSRTYSFENGSRKFSKPQSIVAFESLLRQIKPVSARIVGASGDTVRIKVQGRNSIVQIEERWQKNGNKIQLCTTRVLKTLPSAFSADKILAAERELRSSATKDIIQEEIKIAKEQEFLNLKKLENSLARAEQELEKARKDDRQMQIQCIDALRELEDRIESLKIVKEVIDSNVRSIKLADQYGQNSSVLQRQLREMTQKFQEYEKEAREKQRIYRDLEAQRVQTLSRVETAERSVREASGRLQEFKGGLGGGRGS